jgi:hypothetical protein
MKIQTHLILATCLLSCFIQENAWTQSCIFGAFNGLWEAENTFPVQYLHANPLSVIINPAGDRLDFNGDGFPDLNTRNSRDDQTLPSDSIFIRSGIDLETWSISTVGSTSDFQSWDLVGFFNFDNTIEGQNLKEILIADRRNGLFFDPVVLCADGRVIRKFNNSVLIMAGDMDGDGQDEISVYSLPELKATVFKYNY